MPVLPLDMEELILGSAWCSSARSWFTLRGAGPAMLMSQSNLRLHFGGFNKHRLCPQNLT